MELLIHASPQRMEYVTRFLLPRLNGLKITVWCDHEGKGNLKAYLDSYKDIPPYGDTWHLEDDVLPDRHFRQWAEEVEGFDGIVCGYGSKGYKNVIGQIKQPEDLWYSFPCIRIPNAYLLDMIPWLEDIKDKDTDIRRKVEANKGIDYIFRRYVIDHPIPIYHHDPCMVEHIDDLIGGSLTNNRGASPKAIRFNDREGLEELRRWASQI